MRRDPGLTELIIRKFIKNSQQVKEPSVRAAYGTLAVTVGILTNLLLFAGKVTVGLLFSSVSIIADAVNSLSDAGSSLITLAGVKISAKPADSDHPFGHERAEYICGFLVSLVILLLGAELCRTSVERILHPSPLQFSWLTALVLLLSVLLKLWQGSFYRRIGRRIDSSSIRAAGTDSLNDVASTSAVLAALLLSHFASLNLDGWMGLLVALFILWSGVGVARETLGLLLGEAPSPELLQSIQEKLDSYEGILGVHDLVVHCYGPSKCFASVHVEVPADSTVQAAHEVIDAIEQEFLTQLGIHLVIHMDPRITDDPQLDCYRQMAQEVLQEIDPTLSLHDFRTVTGPSHTKLIFEVTIPFRYPLSPEQLKSRIQQGISKRQANLCASVSIELPFSGICPPSEKSD